MASAQQICNATASLSPLHRIIRYVGKMAANDTNPDWQNDPIVQSIKSGGKTDITKVRQHFIDRNIVTGAEFDQAVADAEAEGLINGPNMNISGPKFTSVYECLETRFTAEQQEKVDQYDANRLYGLGPDVYTDLRVNYNARVNEILDELIAAGA